MIKSEFIIGVIDVEQRTITLNPHFKLIHNYENLIKDMFLSKSEFSNNFDVEQTNEYIEQTNIDSEGVDHLLDVVQSNLGSSLGFLNGKGCRIQLNENGYINEEDIHHAIVDLKEVIVVLKKCIPFLKSDYEILNEI